MLVSPELYLWLKALHIIAVIAWMAGMLYLPRLFVYHCEVAAGSPESERFKLMERRLMRGIINPSMIAVWVLGLTLAIVTHAYTHAPAERDTRLSLHLSEGIRAGSESPDATLLPDPERGAGRADGRNCDPCRR